MVFRLMSGLHTSTRLITDPSFPTASTSVFKSSSQQLPSLLGQPQSSLFPHLPQAKIQKQSPQSKSQRAISVNPAKISFQNTDLRTTSLPCVNRTPGQLVSSHGCSQPAGSVLHISENLPQEKPQETPLTKPNLKSHQSTFHQRSDVKIPTKGNHTPCPLFRRLSWPLPLSPTLKSGPFIHLINGWQQPPVQKVGQMNTYTHTQSVKQEATDLAEAPILLLTNPHPQLPRGQWVLMWHFQPGIQTAYCNNA